MVPEPVTVMEVTPFLVVVVPTVDVPVVEDSVYLCVVPARGERYWKVWVEPAVHQNVAGRVDTAWLTPSIVATAPAKSEPIPD